MCTIYAPPVMPHTFVWSLRANVVDIVRGNPSVLRLVLARLKFKIEKSPLLRALLQYFIRISGKFEMNGSECPMAKILVYKVVNEFLPIRLPFAIRHSNFTLFSNFLRTTALLRCILSRSIFSLSFYLNFSLSFSLRLSFRFCFSRSFSLNFSLRS